MILDIKNMSKRILKEKYLCEVKHTIKKQKIDEKLQNLIDAVTEINEKKDDKICNNCEISNASNKFPFFYDPSDAKLILNIYDSNIDNALTYIKNQIKNKKNIIELESSFKKLYNSKYGLEPTFDCYVNRSQHERLILLYHAINCKNINCNIPFCDEAKQNLKHILKCNNKNCEVPHCTSSRHIICLYINCNDQNCCVCQPVKTIIYSKTVDAFIRKNKKSHFGTFKLPE